MKVQHGVYMLDGKPSKNRKVIVTLEPGDELFHQLIDLVKAQIEAGVTLRHVEAEVKFSQEDTDMYRPESMRIEGVWGR